LRFIAAGELATEKHDYTRNPNHRTKLVENQLGFVAFVHGRRVPHERRTGHTCPHARESVCGRKLASGPH
jgi:hypothetical protein